MNWIVNFHDDFAAEFAEFETDIKQEIAALTYLLEEFGPQLGRPHADTLNASKHANMKELRFKASDGVWRLAFAFDPDRAAILLVAGDKSGVSEKRFYKQLVKTADARFDDHLKQQQKG
ncbi:MAG: type II toxin-antitoxin system RelE/ParE family toxin [Pseudomonadota bacterium]